MHSISDQDFAMLEELAKDLERRLDDPDKVMLTLHIGAGAFAIGAGHVDPRILKDTGNLR